MTIDEEKAIIYGANGSSSYYINDSGGLDLTDDSDGGLTADEFAQAERELTAG